MNPFEWRPPTLIPRLDWHFSPLVEWHTQGNGQPRGSHDYFVLARWNDAGYIATARTCGFTGAGEMRERRISLDELEAYRKELSAISVPLGSSCGAFDGAEGLIRVYHSGSGWIDFNYGNTEQPEWKPLLDFIDRVATRVEGDETPPRDNDEFGVKCEHWSRPERVPACADDEL